MLGKRSDKIAEFGFQSKERILLDEKIKEIFDMCEDALRSLRQVFKVYQNKNKRRVEMVELESRSRNIDLLRKNLNLLQEEFKVQANRTKKNDKKSTKQSAYGVLMDNKDDTNDSGFIDIFKSDKKYNSNTGDFGGVNNINGSFNEEESEEDLN